MWFCYKCNRWYCDSVTIVKHFQESHRSSSSRQILETDNSKSPIMSKSKLAEPSKSKYFSSTPLPYHSKVVVKNKQTVLPTNGTYDRKRKSEATPPKKSSNIAPKDPKIQKMPLETKKQVLQKNINFMQFKDKSKESDSLKPVLSKGKSDDTRTYICKFCCQRFPNGDVLQNHLKIHQGNNKHSCHICGLTTGTFSALMAHYVKHSSMKTFSLANGNKSTFVFGDLEKEVPKKPVIRRCDNCKQEFNTRTLFYTHYCPPSKEKKEFPCVYCRMVLYTVEEYRDHIQSHTPVPHLSCENCSSKFTVKTQLQNHMKTCPKAPDDEYRPSKQTKKTAAKRPRARKMTSRKMCDFSPKTKMLMQNIVKIKQPPTCTVTSKSELSCSKTSDNISSVKFCGLKKVMTDDNDETSPCKKGQLDAQRRLRPKKSRISYSSDASAESYSPISEPTRRSARLGSKKPVRFSESPELDKEIDLESHVSNQTTTTSLKASEVCVSQIDTTVSKYSFKRIPKKNPTVTTVVDASQEGSSSAQEGSSVSPKRLPQTSPKKIPNKPNKLLVKPLNSESKSNALFCNLCSLMFRSLGSLKRHKKMHTGKPQFVCQFCGKFFFRRDIHRRHEGNVHQNIPPSILNCHYCKAIMESTLHLKEHALTFHSNRASAPERIRRCSPEKKKSQVITKPKSSQSYIAPIIVDIKKEVLSDEEENKKFTAPVVKKTSTYNCSSCKVTFDNPSLISEHFLSVHMVAKKKRSSVKTSTCLSIKKEPETKESDPKSENAVMAHGMEDSSVTENQPESDAQAEDSDTDSGRCTELTEEEFTWQTSSPSCDLCFKPLPDTGMSRCKEEHEAVEWFQCAICSTMGSKNQIQEHMMNHVMKIGTFIVNVEEKEYKDLIRYTQQLNEKNGDFPEFIEQDPDSSYLPPYSVCTLMEEVKCSLCKEVIIDFQLLANHPCMRSHEGQYFCFIDDCTFTSDTVTELHEHFDQLHFKPLYIDSRYPDHPKMSDFVSEENYMIDFNSNYIAES